MKTRVVVLGAGFGGLELTTILSDAFGDAVEIVLIDKNDAFVFGFSKLDVMFGRQMPAEVRHPYHDIGKPGCDFCSPRCGRLTRKPDGWWPTTERSKRISW